MFENIGDKIKALAKICTWVGIVASGILGLVIIIRAIDYDMGGLVVLGFAVMGLGGLMSWISSFLLYAIGELVDDVSIIRYNLGLNLKKSEENANKIVKGIDSNTSKIITLIEENKKEQQ
ncbi:MAG: hypothetical protein J6Q58_03685 [Clostridia bacterium]|nr:hypothetical protein [Clostridia bacterium]